MTPPVLTLPNKAAWIDHVITHISSIATKAITSRGRFVLVLAGGNTPKPIYKALAKSQQDWAHWHMIYGDERYLAEGHPDRNQSMVEHSFGNIIEQLNHYPVPNNGNLEEDAAHYAATIEKLMPADCCLLGIGEDGHTASLFKGLPVSTALVSAVEHAPKSPAERISLTPTALNDSAYVFFITGDDKAHIINEGLQQKTLPFSQIEGKQRTQFFIYQETAT